MKSCAGVVVGFVAKSSAKSVLLESICVKNRALSAGLLKQNAINSLLFCVARRVRFCVDSNRAKSALKSLAESIF